MLGAVHEEIIASWTRQEHKSHQLLLLPRDHMKSALVAYRCAWKITKEPWTRIVYLSSTSTLATKQLKMIKDILTCKIYRRYWPEMVNEDEGKREKWTESEISVDHPLRKREGIRDATVFTGGLTTNIAGLHCDVAALDDIVVIDNAYTEEGRNKVREAYSLIASVEAADAEEWVVGTRYHPEDLYNDLLEMEQEILDEDGNIISSDPVYEVFERQVEDKGDGTGEYIWPRAQRKDGKWFGFNQQVLAKKKAQYLDKTQFFAQYYNDPNKYEDSVIAQDRFQYYDRTQVTQKQGKWYVRGRACNLFAAMDFAYSTGARSDYSVIAVVGVDPDGFIYVLDIDRFKTSKISEMFEHVQKSYLKWNYRKIRMETSAAQATIVRELKDQYIRPFGLALSIDEKAPTRHEGTKEERVMAILQPRYQNQTIWHYRGGACQLLEEEIVQKHPAHDDIKDALAAAIEISVAPKDMSRLRRVEGNVIYPRFGGVN